MLISTKFKELKTGEIMCDSNQLGLIIEYLRKNPQVRVNVFFRPEEKEDKLAEQIDKLSKVAQNYTVCCSTIQQLKYCGSQGFNRYWRYEVSNWEEFSHFQNLEVSDILIEGPLCFQMDLVKKRKRDTLIRVNPVTSFCSSLVTPINSPKTFFIRPEDIDLYEPYIDVLELYSITAPANVEMARTMLKFYTEKKYFGDLRNIVSHLKINIDNNFLTENFTKNRLNCGQVCFSREDCNLCRNAVHFLNQVKEAMLNADD